MKSIPQNRTSKLVGGSLGRRTKTAAAAAVSAFALLTPQWAAAQDAQEPDPWAPVTEEPEATADVEETRAARDTQPAMGTAVAAGGGVSSFAQDDAQDFVDTGGAWELRGIFGTNSIVGLEAAYIGAAYDINAIGESSTLFGNGLELSGRLNVLRNGQVNVNTGFQPYLLAGVAWKNYQLSDDLETASVDDADDAFEVPVGTGVAYYFDNGVMLDGRFAYRFAFDEELIEPIGDDEASLDNWSVTGRLGVEF